MTATIAPSHHSLTITEAWGRMKTALHKHTDFIEYLGVLTLNTCVVAQKIFKQIPQIVGNGAMTCLSYMGVRLISLNLQVSALLKSAWDINWSYKVGDFLGCLITVSKTSVIGIDLLLCCGLFAASLTMLFGFPLTTALMFKVMKPWAMISLTVDLALKFFDGYQNIKLNRQIEAIKIQPDGQLKISLLAHEIISLCNKDEKSHKITPLSTQIVRQLNFSTIETVKKKWRESSNIDDISSHLLDYLKKGVEDRQKQTLAGLVLNVLGYIAIVIGRIYPTSLLKSVLNWMMSLFYTTKLGIEKYHNENRDYQFENVKG